MDASYDFALAIAEKINSYQSAGATPATVTFRPTYDVDREDALKIFVVPSGIDVKRSSFSSYDVTAFAEVGLQQYVGDPFDQEKMRRLIGLMGDFQFALAAESLLVDNLKFDRIDVDCETLFDEGNLINASLFTGVFLVTAYSSCGFKPF